MLRITRRVGERIIFGDDVVVEVMEIKGNMVRLGIDAPRSLPVYREEIWLDVKRENQAAAQSRHEQLPGLTAPRDDRAG
jgi:carbon storage regulator